MVGVLEFERELELERGLRMVQTTVGDVRDVLGGSPLFLA